MENTKMFTDRAIFWPEYASLEQVQMSQYLSMINMKIQEFISTQLYRTLIDLH